MANISYTLAIKWYALIFIVLFLSASCIYVITETICVCLMAKIMFSADYDTNLWIKYYWIVINRFRLLDGMNTLYHFFVYCYTIVWFTCTQHSVLYFNDASMLELHVYESDTGQKPLSSMENLSSITYSDWLVPLCCVWLYHCPHIWQWSRTWYASWNPLAMSLSISSCY